MSENAVRMRLFGRVAVFSLVSMLGLFSPLPGTTRACFADELTQKIIFMASDSRDPVIVERVDELIHGKGTVETIRLLAQKGFLQRIAALPSMGASGAASLSWPSHVTDAEKLQITRDIRSHVSAYLAQNRKDLRLSNGDHVQHESVEITSVEQDGCCALRVNVDFAVYHDMETGAEPRYGAFIGHVHYDRGRKELRDVERIHQVDRTGAVMNPCGHARTRCEFD